MKRKETTQLLMKIAYVGLLARQTRRRRRVSSLNSIRQGGVREAARETNP